MASLLQLTELPRRPSGVGLQIWWGRACRFDSRYGQFFFLLMMMVGSASERKARALKRVPSTNYKAWGSEATENANAKHKAWGSEVIENASAKRKAQSLCEQSNQIDVPEWAQQMYALVNNKGKRTPRLKTPSAALAATVWISLWD